MSVLSAGYPGGVRRLGRCGRRVWWSILGLVFPWGGVSHADAALGEFQVKAVFLFNFATFVEWPVDPGAAADPFVIGILGTDPFDGALEQVVAGEEVRGRPLLVRRFDSDDIPPCDILFIGRSEAGRLSEVLQALEDRPVLTVSDLPRFAEAGGMIGFSTEGGRVRLTINPRAVEAHQLMVSAKLLRLARIVDATTR